MDTALKYVEIAIFVVLLIAVIAMGTVIIGTVGAWWSDAWSGGEGIDHPSAIEGGTLPAGEQFSALDVVRAGVGIVEPGSGEYMPGLWFGSIMISMVGVAFMLYLLRLIVRLVFGG